MKFEKVKQWFFLSKDSANLIDNGISFCLPLALLLITAIKTEASEAKKLLERLNNLENNDTMSQINSVDRLRDVSPTDWAYEALRSLVDRYGCIVGFPDRTYLGNQAISRYEFAAGVNACLNQIERLILLCNLLNT